MPAEVAAVNSEALGSGEKPRLECPLLFLTNLWRLFPAGRIRRRKVCPRRIIRNTHNVIDRLKVPMSVLRCQFNVLQTALGAKPHDSSSESSIWNSAKTTPELNSYGKPQSPAANSPKMTATHLGLLAYQTPWQPSASQSPRAAPGIRGAAPRPKSRRLHFHSSAYAVL